jgi:uncharacterized small protein (DUF1192 family)
MDDDDLPRSPAPRPASRDLTPLSIAELEAHIAELKAEIARTEATIKAKLGQRTGAESFFKK